MEQRGKFLSLTMVNWNGFFARTFDIDNLITTLSGGNGAGKSTTMAAFITALIPDQSLLHFRNTTEAGSASASRDKGLHGKLKPGVCYAALEVVNSGNERLIFGVRLQQIAGRDKKVDIKPFIIERVEKSLKTSELFVDSVNEKQVRVRALNEVKEVINKSKPSHYKSFSSTSDYHAQLFDLGVLPKKLRTSQDRAKFYRLIEASLYGGISSAITKSLRDYLLPQNGGVKKAFQDMEVALRENRATLDAIKLTQRDRDLFKHLVTESTHYVASDYMRHQNQRRKKVELSLDFRAELLTTRQRFLQLGLKAAKMSEEQALLENNQSLLEQEQQSASSHLLLVQSAMRQQEKITRYQQELAELMIRFEEQTLLVEEATAQLAVAEDELQNNEEEVDSLKTQLADYQQALNIQQTQALQYQQALIALEKTRAITEKPQLDIESAKRLQPQLIEEEKAKITALLQLKHKLDILQAASSQFEKGLSLVRQIAGEVPRAQAGSTARALLLQARENNYLAKTLPEIEEKRQELLVKQKSYQQALSLTRSYEQQYQVCIKEKSTLDEEQAAQQARLETSEQQQDKLQEKQRELKSETLNIQKEIARLTTIAPAWIKAQHALEKLIEQSGENLDSQSAVLTALQTVMIKEQEAVILRDKLLQHKTQLEEDIVRLAEPGGSNNARLQALADSLGGTLLSEIYDDIALSDAPYFSALYGPARHAIVVPDIKAIKHKLTALEDCPEDLYLIEGDAGGFDDTVYKVEELAQAVCVHLNPRQLRFSRFPKIPLFGRAAREQRAQELRVEYEMLSESYAKTSFDVQKLQRLKRHFNAFISAELSYAFIDSPELGLKKANEKRIQISAEIKKLDAQCAEYRLQAAKAKEASNKLSQLAHKLDILQEQDIEQRISALDKKHIDAKRAFDFIKQHEKALVELESLVAILDTDPEQGSSLKQAYQQLDSQLQQIKTTLFTLSDLLERRHHFNFKDASLLLDKSSELSEQLKIKLSQASSERLKNRERVKHLREQHNTYYQLLTSLKTAHQAKRETADEFLRELNAMGLTLEKSSLREAQAELDKLSAKLSQTRSRKSELEKSVALLEMESKNTQASIRKLNKEYQDLRTMVVRSKVNWVVVLKIARDSGVDKLLTRREMAYMAADELRSLSDKALGALRLAVSDNDILRDALRFSEDVARPERKVLFYVAVYQHLRERIRQDIIVTDDPIEAIEEMEVELARLTYELTQREKRLVLSSESVANLIRKTILREQNRIRLLNQGLSNITFGQVNGVRLNIAIRETHLQLLTGLSDNAEQHQDLFGNNALTFSEAMAKVYQRLNPYVDIGQRSLQTLGEALLDYRNYLELSIEVNRGTDGWLLAESGALSTGEAIGTGQAILLMVVQSWEEESRRLRAKGIVPCRLLFLDEAARLDAKSISTLFELCHRLDMQLLIAAPENISPEQGTTYKLVRKIFNNKEHVHVVGLRGFKAVESTENTVDIF